MNTGIMKFKALFLSLLLVFVSACSTGHVYDRGTLQDSIQESSIHEIGELTLVAFSKEGKEIWKEKGKNALGNDGAQQMLDVYLRGGTAVTNFYLGLTDSTTPCSIGYADTLATVVGYGEPSGNGYARQQITHDSTANGWPTLTAQSPGYQATSKTVTFTSTGTIGPIYCVFLSDVVSGTSGKHIAFMATSVARTLANGESLQVTYNLKVQ